MFDDDLTAPASCVIITTIVFHVLEMTNRCNVVRTPRNRKHRSRDARFNSRRLSFDVSVHFLLRPMFVTTAPGEPFVKVARRVWLVRGPRATRHQTARKTVISGKNVAFVTGRRTGGSIVVRTSRANGAAGRRSVGRTDGERRQRTNNTALGVTGDRDE